MRKWLAGILASVIAGLITVAMVNKVGSGDGPSTPTSTVKPVAAIDRPSPGCDETDPAVTWLVVHADKVCDGSGTTLRRLSTWKGDVDNGYAELRLSFREQPIPAQFAASFTVAGISDPGGIANNLGCVALLAHTTTDGSTFDVLSVCGSGRIAIARFANNHATGRLDDAMPSGVSPGVSGTFKVTVTCSPTSVTMTVDNSRSTTRTLTYDPVGTGTAYIALAVVWHDAGARATFSDFHYSTAA
jgi:hypothetical protein